MIIGARGFQGVNEQVIVDDPQSRRKREQLLRTQRTQWTSLRVIQGRGEPGAVDGVVWVSDDGTLHVNWARMGTSGPHLFSARGREFMAVRREGDVLEIYELAK